MQDAHLVLRNLAQLIKQNANQSFAMQGDDVFLKIRWEMFRLGVEKWGMCSAHHDQCHKLTGF